MQGNSKDFCEACQSKFGKCDKEKDVQQKCGPKHNNQKCPASQCCSRDGNCVSDLYHEMLVFGANISQGTGKTFCSVPENCQHGFGFCDSDTAPGGYNMSRDARLPKGDVVYGKIIPRCTVPRTIALTFDDGPSNSTSKLLDILKQANAKATFFIAGNTNGGGAIDQTPEWTADIERMVEEGHQVGSHSWSHPDMDEAGHDGREADMLKNERALTNVLGKYPTYMRPPYIHCTEASGCLKDMKDFGYHVISYSHDSGDWLYPEDLNKMKEQIDLAFESEPQDGNMLLIQHDRIPESAVSLTPYILQKVKEKGWHGKYQPSYPETDPMLTCY